jgi:hypothetical protein
MKSIYFVAAAVLLCACSKAGHEFVGKWSNQYAGGTLALAVTSDGDHFLINEIMTKNDRVIGTYSARVRDGYLVADGSDLYQQISYSKSEDALIISGVVGPMPPFKRMQQ